MGAAILTWGLCYLIFLKLSNQSSRRSGFVQTTSGASVPALYTSPSHCIFWKGPRVRHYLFSRNRSLGDNLRQIKKRSIGQILRCIAIPGLEVAVLTICMATECGDDTSSYPTRIKGKEFFRLNVNDVGNKGSYPVIPPISERNGPCLPFRKVVSYKWTRIPHLWDFGKSYNPLHYKNTSKNFSPISRW